MSEGVKWYPKDSAPYKIWGFIQAETGTVEEQQCTDPDTGGGRKKFQQGLPCQAMMEPQKGGSEAGQGARGRWVQVRGNGCQKKLLTGLDAPSNFSSLAFGGIDQGHPPYICRYTNGHIDRDPEPYA